MYVHIAAEFKIVCDGLTVTSDIQIKTRKNAIVEYLDYHLRSS